MTGFVGRDCSARIAESLNKSDIQFDAVEAFPETRVCTLILDGKNHPTVINEESMDVDSHAAELLLNVVDKWMPRAAAVLGTGSLSRGLSNDFFRYVLERARSVGKFTALDTTGPALAEGVQAKPGFLKLNAPEFAQFSGVSSPRTESVRDYLRKFGSDLAHHTAITFGEVGAICTSMVNCGRLLLRRFSRPIRSVQVMRLPPDIFTSFWRAVMRNVHFAAAWRRAPAMRIRSVPAK